MSGKEEMIKNRLEPGTRLNDKYVIGTEIGSGGFGITYIGFDTVLEHQVAIKEFFPAGKARRNEDGLGVVFEEKYSEDIKLKIESFRKEASLIFGSFDLPGICSILDFFEENSTAYIVQEYLSGGSLKEHLAQSARNRISYDECLSLFTPVLEGLCHLHSMGILHLDISPDNLMLDGEGRLHLIDFGAAASASVLKEEYASPEQFGKTENTGPWSDIFSICAVMYEALTGSRAPSAVARINSKRPLRLISSETDIPHEAEEAIMNGLSMSPQGRFFNVASLMAKLKADVSSVDSLTAKTRAMWGDEWLRIITEGDDIDTETKRLISAAFLRKMKRAAAAGLCVFFIAAAVFTLAVKTHPKEWLLFRARAASRKAGTPESTYYMKGTADYDRIMKAIDEKGADSYSSDTFRSASLTREEYEKLKVKSIRSANTLPIRLTLAKSILEYSLGQDLGSGLDGYESFSINEYVARNLCYAEASATKSFSYRGQDGREYEINVRYDPDTNRVLKVEIEGSLEDVRTAMKTALPLLVPETFLKDSEIDSLLAKTAEAKKKQKKLKSITSPGYDYKKDHITTEEQITNHPRYRLDLRSSTYSDSQEIKLIICKSLY